MKEKKRTLEEEIQRTLDCIDQINRVEENPYFDTRLKQKLKNKKERDSWLPTFLRPIFSC